MNDCKHFICGSRLSLWLQIHTEMNMHSKQKCLFLKQTSRKWRVCAATTEFQSTVSQHEKHILRISRVWFSFTRMHRAIQFTVTGGLASIAICPSSRFLGALKIYIKQARHLIA